MSNHAGVVYTRPWVVDLILDIAGYKGAEILTKVVCEPSCGGGSFLRSIATRLAKEAASNSCLDVESLIGRVVAYELDGDAVDASRRSVVEVLTSSGLSQEGASEVAENWVNHADYLLSPLAKADFVVGNPPYVRSTEIPPQARAEYVANLSTMTKGCDLFVGFFQRGLECLTKDGVLTYICADRWLQNQYGRTLRRFVVDNGYSIDTIVRMYGVNAFEDEVDAYPSITRISRTGGDIRYANCSREFCESDVPELRYWLGGRGEDYTGDNFEACTMPRRTDGSIVPLASPFRSRMVASLTRKYPALEDAGVSIGIGLATGRDKVFVVDNPDVAERDRMLPAFSMRDHRRRTGKERWLVNPWDKHNNLVSLEDYPKLRSYFEAHREDLSRRHVAKKSGDYYRTIDKPRWDIYGREMLLWPDMATRADPVWSDGSKYPCHNCYWMISDRWDLKTLAGLLMSDIAEAFIDALGVKMRGDTLRFQAQYLRLMHVPQPEDIPPDVTRRLAEAFESGDREMANAAARAAYGLEHQ